MRSEAADRWPSRATVGAILAGGASSRFGGIPKGLERVDGARMIDRVAGALRATTHELILVANDPAASGWLPGVRVVPDLVRKAGPLGGIQAALHAAGDRGVLVVAWDMPFVTVALLRALVWRGEAPGEGVSADVGESIVVPEPIPGRPEPVCAYYPTACRAMLDRLLEAGERRPARFLDAWDGVARLGSVDLAGFGDLSRLLRSINTAGDLPVP